MLKDERHQVILETLKMNGRVLAGELAQRFGVSEDTIRRDLRDLADAGHMLRVHGGGLPRSPATASYEDRLHMASEAKQAIAREAVKLVQPGHVLLLDGGTTTLQVARSFPPDLQITVITNSPLIAAELAGYPAVEVIIIGGRLYKNSRVTTGAAVVDAFRAIRADLCMLGVCSLHAEVGISLPDYEESQVKRAMLESAHQVAALASAEKLGTASTHVIAPIDALTYLVTEPSIPEEVLDGYRAAGVTVISGA
jgi:DeoR/GlpR family transcriptional regulator of sugar metabolism